MFNLQEIDISVKKAHKWYYIKLDLSWVSINLEKELKITEDDLWSVLWDGIMLLEDRVKSRYIILNRKSILYECLLAYTSPRVFNFN